MTEKQRKQIKRVAITCVVLLSILVILTRIIIKSQKSIHDNIWQMTISESINTQMKKNYFLLAEYMEDKEEGISEASIFEKIMSESIPLYRYVRMMENETETEDDYMEKMIMLCEGKEEDGENEEVEDDILKEMQQENERYVKQKDAETDEKKEEKEEEKKETEGFQKVVYPAYTYDWSEKWGYEELVSNFYAIDGTTELQEEYMDIEKLLYQDLAIDTSGDGPQILIYHTHSQEAFADSVPGDASTTIVGAGDKLASLLQEEYGFEVLHHKGEYDVENRDYAYSNSLPEIERILQENPSIEVVIDLHRDEMREGKKLVMDLQGRPTARFMFFNGMSYIRDKGAISYLENPYIEENLAFSFQAQVAANEYYPGIARRIYLKAYRYNLHLCPKSMLIELGAQTNTVEEIMNACEPLAHIIAIVLKEEM